MKINNSSIDQLSTGGAGAVGATGIDFRSTAGGSLKSDSVQLSDAANLIALAKLSVSSRQAKVLSISNQVRSGSYQTDNSEVSQAVVDGHITK